jgi:hypothetical protein
MRGGACRPRVLGIAPGALALGLALAAGPALAAIFTVDSTGDAPDSDLNDDLCITVGGVCTLRAAIAQSNAGGDNDTDTINFNIGGGGAQTIVLTSPLDPLTDPTIVDGTTQPGWAAGAPLIELNAAGIAGNGIGLDMASGSTGSTVRGLIINRAPVSGIRVLGSSNNVIAGNVLGTNLASAAGLGNVNGIHLGNSGGNNADNNLIGGTTLADANVISGNTVGIFIDGGIGGGGVKAALNRIQGNFIGTDVTGTVARGNTQAGVEVFGNVANNLVGGTAAGEGNTIAFNGADGVQVWNSGATVPTGNSVLGNSIHSNGNLGIDLADNGVTPNDALDADTGPNTLLNFPVITSTYPVGSDLVVNFSLDVTVGTYRIEFFKNPLATDEGEVFAGTRNVTHPGGGARNFSASFAGATGDRITATTTACTDGTCGTLRSTSELSAVSVVVATAVTLMSFTAAAEDAAVELSWQTGSEVSNLGFHLYRSLAAEGPFERITASLIPGLGHSAEGARYSYRDTGLANGATYFYRLEDVEASGRTQLHGPTSATPLAGAGPGPGGAPPIRITYGDPSATSWRILERSERHAVVELRTGGFVATPLADGTVRLAAPLLQEVAAAGEPDIPVLRTWLEAVAGRKVQTAAVRPAGVRSFSLRPADAPLRELRMSANGVARVVKRRAQPNRSGRAVFPDAFARIVTTAFQGEIKKAQLEMAPLRYDARRGELLLATVVTVQVSFAAREPEELSRGGARGRRKPRLRGGQDVLAHLAVRDGGLYAVAFEDIFGPGGRGFLASSLGLSHQGAAIPFHLEPDRRRFGPGSTLVFVTEGAALNPYAAEAVYALVRVSTGGAPMPSASAGPTGQTLTSYLSDRRFETNRLYQAGLLDAPDLWLWDHILAPAAKVYPFTLSLPRSLGVATLRVDLQGGSDSPASPDHHVRVRLNGSLVSDASWDGQAPYTVEAEVASSLLYDGENRLEIQNVGDTGATQSLVDLNRFSLRHPRAIVAVGGQLDGTFESPGTAVVAGLGADASLLDVTDATPRWLTGAAAVPDGLAFRVEAGRRYLAVARGARLRPRVSVPAAWTLRSRLNQADYLLIAPRELLAAAAPLLAHRRGQGLSVRGVAVEDVYAQFGFGEKSPLALRQFLAFAYHEWTAPSPRYVLLLGDATYDPKDYLKTGVRDHVPGLMVRTPFLWTISDPSYASLNGDDVLPDLALGRLSASSLAEAQALVAKVLAFETAGFALDGPRVLVADNTDAGGSFENDADEIAAGLFGGRAEKIYLSQLGGGTRTAIHEALDRGASLLSYVGHGSTFIWASENVFNNTDLPPLAPQARQPLLFTMNCLNGYFHLPGPLSSLGEAFVKADGRGAIAAFAPSGMSFNDAAHLYHKALLEELLSGRHLRLGDAILAAQVRYASTGAYPDLLSLYHLLGDPALKVRD